MSEEEQFAPAIKALERRLKHAESRRRALQDDLAHATTEVRLARLALESIAVLAGTSSWVPEEIDRHVALSESLLTESKLALAPRRRADGSTDRVVELLRSEPRVWTREEVYAVFEARGWTHDWSDPEAAIRMALRRAVQQDAVVQLQPGEYRAKRRQRPPTNEGATNVDS